MGWAEGPDEADTDPEMWMWVEAEDISGIGPGDPRDGEPEPPSEDLNFPIDDVGSDIYRLCKFQSQFIFVQPSD